MYKILLLLAMIFLHIVDDYYLQGWLASAKQKEWWKRNAPHPLYKHDYIMALFMHGFSWAFMIMLVPTIYVLTVASNINMAVLFIMAFFVFNLCLHMFTDNKKANKKEINLIQDQLIHLAQIIFTWTFLVAIIK
jgi:hypothetical protein